MAPEPSRRLRAPLLAAVAFVALSGCASDPAPTAQPEVPPLPAAWALRLSPQLATAAPDADWWNGFDDPQLRELLARADAGNLDLRIAVDRMRAAEAGVRLARSAQSPAVSFNLGSTDPVTERLADPQRKRFDTGNEDHYVLGFQAAYEIDLWGRVRQGVSAAQAESQAARFDVDAARIALHGTVARSYFALRRIDVQRALLRRRGSLLDEQLRLTQLRVDAGRVTATETADVRLAQAALRDEDATLALQRQLAQQTLALLIGEAPESLDLPVAEASGGAAAAAPAAGLPSTLLQRRPDLRAAQARVAAAAAQVGVARAERLPQVALTGALGYLSAPLSHLLHAGAAIFGLGPSISLPLLDGGRHAAVAEARLHEYDAAQASYRKNVLAALGEVEKALLEYQSADEAAIRAQDRSRLFATQRQALARRLAAGRTSRLEQIALEQRALEAEAADLQIEHDRRESLVALYEALGGGWEAEIGR